jgi:hypothetical protein
MGAINGAAHRVGSGDTAFSYRDANFAVVKVRVHDDPGILVTRNARK